MPCRFPLPLHLVWAGVLAAQAPNPAANPNLGWQMQQQQFQAQQMMQMQQQMMRQMQQQQMQQQQNMMRQQAMMRQEAMVQAQRAKALEQKAARLRGFPNGPLAELKAERWRTTLNLADHLPSFDGGRIVGVGTGKAGDKVVCLDLDSGKSAWEHPFSGKLALSPLLLENRVVFVDADAKATALDVDTGKVVFEFQMEPFSRFLMSNRQYHPRVLLPLSDQGRLYLQTYGKGPDGDPAGKAYALELATGKRLWELAIPGGPDLIPAVVEDLVILGGGNQVLGVEVATGKVRWTAPLETKDLDLGPVLEGVVCVTSSGWLHALDAKTGKRLWNVPFHGGFLHGEADRLVFTEVRGAVFRKDWAVALDAKTGEKAWELKLGTGDVLALQGGRVVCAMGRELKALAPATGKELWTLPLNTPPQRPLFPMGGTLYPVTEASRGVLIQAVRLEDGKLLWSHPATDVERGPGMAMVGEGLFILPATRGQLVAW